MVKGGLIDLPADAFCRTEADLLALIRIKLDPRLKQPGCPARVAERPDFGSTSKLETL
jgi:hypothetical protein